VERNWHLIRREVIGMAVGFKKLREALRKEGTRTVLLLGQDKRGGIKILGIYDEELSHVSLSMAKGDKDPLKLLIKRV